VSGSRWQRRQEVGVDSWYSIAYWAKSKAWANIVGLCGGPRGTRIYLV
jgi:hypothetical protein